MSNRQMTKKAPQIRFNGFYEEWNENKINEIAEINPHSELPNIFEYVDLESVVGTEMVSHRTEKKDSAPSRAQRLAKKGDVFYQTVRPYQKNNFYFNRNDNNFVFSTGYAQLRSDFNGTFLLSVLQSKDFVEKVLENCTGTSYPAINPTTLGNLTIKFPNTNEQSKIGTFFSQIDSLIASTQKEHDKLVSLKKCMLQKMFPKKVSLVPEIRFKEFSGDWEEKKLNEGVINEFIVPMRDKPKQFGGTIPWTRIEDIQGKYLNGTTSNQYVSEETVKAMNLKVIPKNSLIVSSSATFGVVAIVTQDLITNQTFIGLVPNSEYNLDFLYILFCSEDVLNKMKLKTAGSTIFYIAREEFENLSTLFPPTIEEQQKIGSYFQNLDILISKQAIELEKLKNVKKTLLNKMFV